MATEYIEKQAAIYLDPPERYERQYKTMNLDDVYEAGWCEALVEILQLPPADVRPVVRGRWEWNEDDGHYYCTVCSSVSPESDQNGDECDCPNFCPNCGSYNGADMREVEEDG